MKSTRNQPLMLFWKIESVQGSWLSKVPRVQIFFDFHGYKTWMKTNYTLIGLSWVVLTLVHEPHNAKTLLPKYGQDNNRELFEVDKTSLNNFSKSNAAGTLILKSTLTLKQWTHWFAKKYTDFKRVDTLILEAHWLPKRWTHWFEKKYTDFKKGGYTDPGSALTS